MNPKHIGLLSSNTLEWQSCKSISKNLREAYRRAFGPLQEFRLTVGVSHLQVWRAAREILDSGIRRLVFIDHVPHPQPLIEALATLCSAEKSPYPELWFHIYGDLTLYGALWVDSLPHLKKFPTKFICASPRQQNLFKRMIRTGGDGVAVCPFPVEDDFKFSAQVRKKERKRLRIAQDETVMLYTGRLSTQKNILAMITEIGTLLSEQPEVPWKFLIAGGVDNLGAPFFGIPGSGSHYFLQIQEQIKRLPEKIRTRFNLLGQLSHSELRRIYCASDVFISLSLHHDEDFGMSPAEALMSGMPCLLTDWGGYAQFNSLGECSRGVPVEITRKGLSISRAELSRGLFELISRRMTPKQRAECGEQFGANYGVPAISKLIKQLHLSYKRPVFVQDGTSVFRSLAQKLRQGVTPFPDGPTLKGLYPRIYRAYVRE